MIELHNINKSYGSGKNLHKALNDINIAFRETEFVAILGTSGSGKTTLLNVIGGLDHYDDGDLIIDNISTRKYTSKDWDSYRNHSIGFIFQSYHLIQHQTILANVEMALSIAGISGKEKRDRAEEALREVGLQDHINKLPSQLSGGQMQRVAIARALVNNPSVILADEPTGALDSKTSVQVMELLQEAAKNRLIIMVTHNPQLAEDYASRIITLKDGEIIGDTAPFHPVPVSEPPENRNMGHASMGILTALSLSFHNLWTKRKRTFLTSFAGSIGIIGIALIASLSTGVNDYIHKQEVNMAYQYPLLVETLNMDISSVLTDLSGELLGADSGHVEVVEFLQKMFAMLSTNDLRSFKAYLDQAENDISQEGTIEYVYNVSPQIYIEYGDNMKRVCPDATLDSLGLPISNMDTSLISSSVSTNMFYCMPKTESLYIDRYNLKAGKWPAAPNECILVLTNEGKITDYMLYILGLRDPNQVDSFIKDFIHGKKVRIEDLEDLNFAYEDFLGITFKLVKSSDYYTYDKDYEVWRDRSGDTRYLRELVRKGDALTIVGVVQPKPEYGAGVLKPGIDYPFSLVEKTIADAAKSDIVKAQLAHPETDVFSGSPFDEMGAAKKLDPMSLVNADTELLRSAIILDEEKLTACFMSGADFSAIHVQMPDINLEEVLDIGYLTDKVRGQIRNDLPYLIGDIRISSDTLNSVIYNILSDYASYLEDKGYLHPDQLFFYLNDYFTSDTFASLVQNWAMSLERESTDEEYFRSAVWELSQQILESLNAYLNAQGIPSIPFLQETFTEYLTTGRWKEYVLAGIADEISRNQIDARIADYMDTVISPMIEQEILSAFSQFQELAEEIADTLTRQTKAAIEVSLANGVKEAISHATQCVTADMDIFMSAFSMRLDTQELSDLLLSFTNLSKASVSKNLSRLGYVAFSHPKSIRIYPRDFESKDAIIAVMNRYNRLKESENQQSDIISYTDTLGTVMSMVMRIITIITGALVATVAVSLVVSSIMIGVITYISVLERRKEIGILRAMGASRHNISQIFNAETFITGMLSGCMGVLLALILLIPLNLILHKATGIYDIYAVLPISYGVILILISVILTTIGGIIPSHNASKSDPVEALRSE